jgi:glycerol-3-phosphate dehydrogenase
VLFCLYDVIIIGGGVTGAACAYALSRYNLRVAVLEKSNDVAVGTTKANSAIIHAGYDPKPGSLMARLNVEGCAMAKDLCERLDVPYLNCGSLVLAFSDADMEHVRSLYERGCENGVPGMRILGAEEVKSMEPQLSDEVKGALWAPSAGIVNPWEYALAMAETAVRNGTELHLETAVTGIEKTAGDFTVHTTKGDFETRFIVSAAGVYADKVHSMLEKPEYSIIPTRGQYYLLDKSEGTRVSRVIFQCPNEKGKGVLVAPTVHGNLIVGPDANICEADDLSTDAEGLVEIGRAAKRSVPGVDLRQNIRNFAGVRANADIGDFYIQGSRSFPGFIDAACIKSPGLTAAPAIGEYVVTLLEKCGLHAERKSGFIDRRERIKFKELTDGEKNALIAREPAYGRIVCRCETVTEGEIVACLHSPIPPTTINGVKRRVGAGMGRCQGGFCSPKVHELIVRELGLDWMDVCLEEPGSELLFYETKKEARA